MNSAPYRNEPHYEETPLEDKHLRQYNQYIRYEVLRVAVCGMVDQALFHCSSTNAALAKRIREHCVETVEFCKYLCDEYSFLDGRSYVDCFSGRRVTYDFGQLKRLLEQTALNLSSTALSVDDDEE